MPLMVSTFSLYSSSTTIFFSMLSMKLAVELVSEEYDAKSMPEVITPNTKYTQGKQCYKH